MTDMKATIVCATDAEIREMKKDGCWVPLHTYIDYVEPVVGEVGSYCGVRIVARENQCVCCNGECLKEKCKKGC